MLNVLQKPKPHKLSNLLKLSSLNQQRSGFVFFCFYGPSLMVPAL